jgi:hypothetical protein
MIFPLRSTRYSRTSRTYFLNKEMQSYVNTGAQDVERCRTMACYVVPKVASLRTFQALARTGTKPAGGIA